MNKNIEIERFEVGSRYLGEYSYVSKSGKRYTWTDPSKTVLMTKEEILELLNAPGGERAITETLIIPEKIAAELNFNFEPEYYFTFDELKILVEEATMEQLTDALEFNNRGVREAIKDAALEIEVADANKRQLFEEEFGVDFTNYIAWKDTEDPKKNEKRSRRSYFKL